MSVSTMSDIPGGGEALAPSRHGQSSQDGLTRGSQEVAHAPGQVRQLLGEHLGRCRILSAVRPPPTEGTSRSWCLQRQVPVLRHAQLAQRLPGVYTLSWLWANLD